MTKDIEGSIKKRGRPAGSKNSNTTNIIPVSHLKDSIKNEILYNRLYIIIEKTKKEFNLSDKDITYSVHKLLREIK